MLRLSRESIQKISLMAAGAAAGFLIILSADFILTQKSKNINTTITIMTSDSSGFYQPKPNFHATINYGPLKYTVYTDKFGYRTAGPKRTKTKTTFGCPSIYFVGDSFTWGSGLNWDQTYPGQFSKIYRGHVVNMGVESHSPTTHLYRIKSMIEQHKPSKEFIIIAGIDISDVQDEASVWSDNASGPPKKIDTFSSKTNSSESYKDKITSSFSLTYNLYKKIKDLLKPLFFIRSKPNNQSTPQAARVTISNLDRSAFTYRNWKLIDSTYQPLGIKGGITKMDAKIADMNTLIKNSGGILLLLEYPWPAQLEYRQSKLNWPKHISYLCAKIGCAGTIHTTSLFNSKSMTGHDWYAKYYLSGDMHFNSHGYSIIASSVTNNLLKILPKNCFNL